MVKKRGAGRRHIYLHIHSPRGALSVITFGKVIDSRETISRTYTCVSIHALSKPSEVHVTVRVFFQILFERVMQKL